ncbi:hypothetical protein SDC9_101607 [bioreactor metagenome]|uniref:Uncharacterized protein n=1 Tax=bioreactor metagenome TaxID=1076179 RepID=A0A645ANL3_9ZZZZ
MGDGDDGVPFGGLFGGRADGDFSRDDGFHVGGEFFGSFGEDVVDPEFVDAEELRYGLRLGPSLDSGAEEAYGEGFPFREKVFQRHGGLGAGPQVGDEGAVHHPGEDAVPGVDEDDDGTDVGQAPGGVVHPSTGPLDARRVHPPHVGGHGVDVRMVGGIGAALPEVEGSLGGVDDGSLAHPPVGFVQYFNDVLHGDELLHVGLAQQPGHVLTPFSPSGTFS